MSPTGPPISPPIFVGKQEDIKVFKINLSLPIKTNGHYSGNRSYKTKIGENFFTFLIISALSANFGIFVNE